MTWWKENRWWCIACGLAALVYLVTVPGVWQCEGMDEIEYLSLANSLVRGYGYTIYGRPHVLYPPLYPFLLSLVMRLGTAAWHRFYLLNAVLGIAGWVLVGTWMRRRLGETGRWAAWFLLVSYYAWSFPCRFLMSEPLFLPLSFGTVIVAWRVLERNEGRTWEYGLFAVLCLLCGMTRAAAVFLNLALVLAGGSRWVTTRRRAGLAVAGIALAFGVGYFMYWSARAVVVAPEAESHWAWAMRYLGLPGKFHGIVASGEEISPTSTSPVGRTVLLTTRLGQFLASLPRVPGNFLPLATVLAVLFLSGLAVHWRRWLWSPMAWYIVVFFAMILKTTWVTNYLRFLLVLAPFLFLLFFEGTRWLYNHVAQGKRAIVALLLGGVGVWGLVPTFSGPVPGGWGEMGNTYVRVTWILLMAVYAGLLGAVVWLSLGRPVPGLRAVRRTLPVLLVAATIHSGVLVAARARLGRESFTLESRNLEGAVVCGEWFRTNTAAEVRCVASVPRMASFLSDRHFVAPDYTGYGKMVLDDVDYVLLIGLLPAAAPYWFDDETGLRDVSRMLEQQGLLETVFCSGDARVYRVIGNDE
ncbi:MAG: hypothetical protein JXB04_12015 [Kiritimatiellae bacterium]|nr:hypothetical protein [Kiritimatiellia bacterium]